MDSGHVAPTELGSICRMSAINIPLLSELRTFAYSYLSSFPLLSPAMISRVSGLDGDERAAAGRADLPLGDELCFDDGAVFAGFDDARYEFDLAVGWSRAPQLDGIVSRHCAGWMICVALSHQMIRRRPV